MNKQEALEGLLEVCRKQEDALGRPVVAEAQIARDMAQAVHNLDLILAMPPSARQRAKLAQWARVLGGLALYLLVDEVEVVAGRALDEWLAQRPPGVSGGSSVLSPTRLNGMMVITEPPRIDMGAVQEAYQRGVRDGGGRA